MGKGKKKKLVQSILPIGNSLTQVTCSKCNFQYFSTNKESLKQHENLHKEILLGIKLSKKVIRNILKVGNVIKSLNIDINNKVEQLQFVSIKCADSQIIKVVTDVLKLVNNVWLNSNSCSSHWAKHPDENMVILIVSLSINRVIGILTTDTPPSPFNYLKGYHMDIETSTIDDKKPKLKLKLGISRIFVSYSYRRNGLATMMLDEILKHAFYGMTLSKWQIGFSQPSSIGSNLLKNWYATTTSTTPNTNIITSIPVYHES